MSKEGMIQWAPGTKPQRMDRSDPTFYKKDMETIAARVASYMQPTAKAKERALRYNFKAGDIVTVSNQDNIEIVDHVDHETGSVYLGIYPHGPEDLIKFPNWFQTAFKQALKEVTRVKSTHRVEVVPVKLEPHPNADSLSIVHVYGFQVVVRTEDWKDKTIGAYIPPDSICPDTPEFEWLGDKKRIRARKLRGVVSMGLLVPAPDGTDIGDEVSGKLGITHYEPEEKGTRFLHGEKDAQGGPQIYAPHYDVSNARRYLHLLAEGEEVVATEKVHGANARYVYLGDRFWCGSRNQWKQESQNCVWWQALAAHPELQEWLKANNGKVVYGEVYGSVQSLRYDCLKGEVKFVAFDIMRVGEWVGHDEARRIGASLPWVPVIYRGPWDFNLLADLAEGDSVVAGGRHHMEGLVIKPINERQVPDVGRLQLKLISNRYLEK